MLAVERPTDAILGEEQGQTGSSARRWIVDPIDGTRNYARGIPVWATLIALEEDGRSRSASSPPRRSHRPLVGRARGGRIRERRPVRVSRSSPAEDAVLSFASGERRPARSRDRAWHARGLGDFWAHMLVAEGAVDGAVDAIGVSGLGPRRRAGDRRGGRRDVHGLRAASTGSTGGARSRRTASCTTTCSRPYRELDR